MSNTVNKIPKNSLFSYGAAECDAPELVDYDYQYPEDEGIDFVITDEFKEILANKDKQPCADVKVEEDEGTPKPVSITMSSIEIVPVYNSSTVTTSKRYSTPSPTPYKTPSPTPIHPDLWADTRIFEELWRCPNAQDVWNFFSRRMIGPNGIPVWNSEKFKYLFTQTEEEATHMKLRVLSAIFTKGLSQYPAGIYNWSYSVLQHSTEANAIRDQQPYYNPPGAGQSSKFSDTYRVSNANNNLSCSHTETQVYISNMDYFKTLVRAISISGGNSSSVTVLNMGSPNFPGDGWDQGYFGLEAEIFMRTNISSSLANSLYPLNNYDTIFTPSVTLLRTEAEEGYRFLGDGERKIFNVVTASAYNRRANSNISENDLRQITYNKAISILETCVRNRSRVLILGAFGCGYFNNPPDIVAQEFGRAIKRYTGKFDYVFFSILNEDTYKKFKDNLGFKKLYGLV